MLHFIVLYCIVSSYIIQCSIVSESLVQRNLVQLSETCLSLKALGLCGLWGDLACWVRAHLGPSNQLSFGLIGSFRSFGDVGLLLWALLHERPRIYAAEAT